MAELAAPAILRCTSGFVDDVLSQPELRRRILASARLGVPSALLAPALRRALSLLSQSPENSPAVEKLVLALPRPTPLSSLLLALACGFRRRHVSAALALLDVFSLDPALARAELAQPVFEGLFVPRLLPAVEWFSERRSRISSSARGGSKERQERAAYARMPSFEPMTLLSGMSGEQAEELRELERAYEDAMDANCRIYAEYLKKVLEGSDDPCPELVYAVSSGKGGGLGELKEDHKEEVEEEEKEFGSNGQYNNPMWGEGEEDQSAESSSPHSSAGQSENGRATYHPRRVQPHILNMHPSEARQSTTTDIARAASTPGQAYAHDGSFGSDAHGAPGDGTSSEYEQELEETNIERSLLHSNQDQKHEQPSVESSCSCTTTTIGDPDFLASSGKQNPPKDFVCPITSNVFDDPVTLETGQTYERAAIQEWLGRGNTTCPITRHHLSATTLPKTNYVLKRLIAGWRDRNPTSTPNRSPPPPPPPPRRAPSPTSVISQALSTGTAAAGDLRLAVSKLCTSDLLAESETAVLLIERCWREAGAEERGTLLTALSKPAVVNGLVEVLLHSAASPRALAAAVYVLSEMAWRDGSVVQTLTRVGSDVECVAALFREGLAEAAVLIYLLNPPRESLVEMDVAEALIATVGSRDGGSPAMCLGPKTASVLLLSRILRGDGGTASAVARAVISGSVVERVVRRLDAELVEERVAAVGILARCMEEDGKCRNTIADRAEIAPVLECFPLVDDEEKFEIVLFLYELVKLRRRSFNQQILRAIKDQGASSTMHALLVYLQTALRDQAPIVGSLLLQLDLLVEPKKMSMYREEAIETLISCLKDSNFQNGQQIAAETIVSLQGRFSYSGKPLARAFLLKHAGMKKSFKAIMRSEEFGYALEDSKEKLVEEKAAVEWESRVAFALASHEFGLVFEALAEGMRSKNASFFSACLVSATWLVHMLSVLPDTGIRGAARHCLLKQYISILKSSNNLDDKALAMLAVRSFMNDADGMKDLSFYIKDILKTIRELKKSSVLAYDMLKILSDGKESSSDIWNHKELNQVDCSTNGEVLSIVYFKNRIFSGHSDGTIKVWEGGARILDLIQESHEHTKAVTSLSILQSGEKLYSGSLDKTVRVWTVRDKNISCVEVHDMRDQVHNLTVANTIACFTPQGAGVKVFSWNGGSKLLNPNKSVKSLALVHGKLYCGCQDNSIQEIDLATGTLGAIQAGNRKLLGKSHPVHALQVHDGLLYSAGSSVDGTMIKIHNASNYSQIGSLSTNLDVRTMAIGADLIYMGCKSGYVDIWSREKLTRVATLQLKTNSKVVCMSLVDDGDVLVVGTSDGRIQAWGLT